MNLLKNFLVRLSDSFFSSVPLKLKPGNRKRHQLPPLKLVSQNPNPPHTPDMTRLRGSLSAVGHTEVLDDAIHRSRSWLLARQNPEQGYWVAELEADTTLTSEYIMLRRFMDLVDPERERKAIRYLQQSQIEDGGWPIYTGGPSDISASVKAYFALKLAGSLPMSLSWNKPSISSYLKVASQQPMSSPKLL